MGDIIRTEGPDYLWKSMKVKVLEDKVRYLETELSALRAESDLIRDITEDVLDKYFRHKCSMHQMPEWLDEHYDESPMYDVTENSVLENVYLLDWIKTPEEFKRVHLDDELAEYFYE